MLVCEEQKAARPTSGLSPLASPRFRGWTARVSADCTRVSPGTVAVSCQPLLLAEAGHS